MPNQIDNITYSVKWDNLKTKERCELLKSGGLSTNWKWRYWSFLPAWLRDELIYIFRRNENSKTKTDNT